MPGGPAGATMVRVPVLTRAPIAAATLGLVGLLCVFVLPDAPLTLHVDVPAGLRTGTGAKGPLDGYVLVIIPTLRAIGILATVMASAAGSFMLGRSIGRGRRAPHPRPTVALASFLALVGLLLVFVIDTQPTFSIGSFGTSSVDDEGAGMPFLLFLTAQRSIGLALLWGAIALAALAAGLGSTRTSTSGAAAAH